MTPSWKAGIASRPDGNDLVVFGAVESLVDSKSCRAGRPQKATGREHQIAESGRLKAKGPKIWAN